MGIGKDYSGAKFFYTEPISLSKAHSRKLKAFNNKTLHLYNHSLGDNVQVFSAIGFFFVVLFVLFFSLIHTLI